MLTILAKNSTLILSSLIVACNECILKCFEKTILFLIALLQAVDFYFIFVLPINHILSISLYQF